ncbi:MAG TPA: hypothetical protein PLN95_02180 [Candidatus Saccharibacteria bacterium]|nr:hypothetical protein [Candidatus Saccharibacteria bacterium]
MKNQSKLSIQVLALTATLLAPVITLFAISIGLSGLEGINPENHDRERIIPVSEPTEMLVKQISVYIIAPLGIVLAILSLLNLKFANENVHRGIIAGLLVTACWFGYAFWATSGQWVTVDETSPSSDGSLQIRSFDIE